MVVLDRQRDRATAHLPETSPGDVVTVELSPALSLWKGERRHRLRIAQRLAVEADADSLVAAYLLGAQVIALVAEFQGYCSDLLSDVVDVALRSVNRDEKRRPLDLVLRTAMTTDRAVDTRNPTSANLARDFARLGMKLRDDLAPRRLLKSLDAAVTARNALAHAGGDLHGIGIDGSILTARHADQWASDLDALAGSLDSSVREHLTRRLDLDAW
jgi:hypothetical protein